MAQEMPQMCLPIVRTPDVRERDVGSQSIQLPALKHKTLICVSQAHNLTPVVEPATPLVAVQIWTVILN